MGEQLKFTLEMETDELYPATLGIGAGPGLRDATLGPDADGLRDFTVNPGAQGATAGATATVQWYLHVDGPAATSYFVRGGNNQNASSSITRGTRRFKTGRIANVPWDADLAVQLRSAAEAVDAIVGYRTVRE